ncbi:MAG: hypothetical protein QNM02_07350, partial [Acidimicrobiia bacterium]|nr:hypothetical protein [Acidimicrobiia bacterium]
MARRAGILAFTLAMVVAVCGAFQTSSNGSPAVEITSIELDGPLTIEWTITCRASSADSLFLPLSISECDALDDSRGVSLGTARLTVKA